MEIKESGRYQKQILVALNNPYLPRSKHIYGGTVPQATIDRNRAANKVARKSRRVNRRKK